MQELFDIFQYRNVPFATLDSNGALADLSEQQGSPRGLYAAGAQIGSSYLDVYSARFLETIGSRIPELLAGTVRHFTCLFRTSGSRERRWLLIVGLTSRLSPLDLTSAYIFHVPLTSLLASDAEGGLLQILESRVGFKREDIIVHILRDGVSARCVQEEIEVETV